MRPTADPDGPRRGRTWWARWAVGSVTALGGFVIAVVIAAVGRCSAFRGRCPAEPEPLLQDDAFRLVAVTLAITVWVVSWCIRPDRRGAVIAFLVGLISGVLGGIVAATTAAG